MIIRRILMTVNINSLIKKCMAAVCIILLVSIPAAYASSLPFGIFSEADSPRDNAVSIQIILLLTVLVLAPSILIMMTGFTRIIIILSFIRNALGLHQMPPNQVLIGIALFITFYVMSPVITQVNETAYTPYIQEKITQQQAFDNALIPIREFMLKQTYPKELNLFLSMANMDVPETFDEIPTHIIIPAFIISELKKAFQIGFYIFLPFIVIDMIVASTLMSMGMMMLPPTIISLPFKIMLFVLVDGWSLTIQTIITSFN